eukprot:Sspe_Gene.13990::Locus_4823_Transcript_2_2_Confidence_0.500_Length_1832::g.13990::m.13990/K17800/LETM1, MDM38; LETM1 and EF-hand domain-containing protein 1, mitochondrial
MLPLRPLRAGLAYAPLLLPSLPTTSKQARLVSTSVRRIAVAGYKGPLRLAACSVPATPPARFHSDVAASSSEKGKKTRGGILSQAWDAVLHVYHGTRLLIVNTKVALKLKARLANGGQLTRRERQLLERTARDLLRMVPFSFFIIVPGAELLLPVALIMFPDLMPSTFTTREQTRKLQIVENIKKGKCQRRVFEHLFTRVIIDEGFDLYSPSWGILKRANAGNIISAADIRILSKHFTEGKKLDLPNLPSWILRDIARIHGLYSPFAARLMPTRLYDARLRTAIEEYMNQMHEDDKSLNEAGVSSLTEPELEAECIKRRIRWFGSPSALRMQLKDWIDLSLDPEIPLHVLTMVKPCATMHQDMLKSLSSNEISHALGFKAYEDAPMKKQLNRLIRGVNRSHTAGELDESVMAKDVTQIIDTINGLKADIDAADNDLKMAKEELKDIEDDRILNWYHEIMETRCGVRVKDKEKGIKVADLSRGLLEKMKEAGIETKLTPFRLIMSLREFDLDESDVISFEEFKGFLQRIRSD